MPIERQQLQQSIGAGNFGQAGVPLGGSREKGPDYSRLLDSLGVTAGKVAEENQKVNVDAAKAAIREATINSKSRPKGMTKEAHREFQRNTINSVREQFEDQGAFLDIFAGENKAVQTIDDFNGRAKALEVRNTMKQLMVNTQGLSLEEREAKLLLAMQEGSSFTNSISERSKQSYLDAITEAGLQNADQLLAEDNERTKQLSTAAIYDTSYKELDESLTPLAGFSTEDMKSNIDSFEAGQANMDTNLEAMKDKLRVQLKGTRSGLNAVLRDPVASGAKTMELLISTAKRMGKPELLDLAEEDLDGSGNPLAKFHREEIEKARQSINQVRETTRQNLTNKKAMEVQRSNKEQYSQMFERNNSAAQAAIDAPEDKEAAITALDGIDEEIAALEINSEDYKENVQHYTHMRKMLLGQKALIGASIGDPQVEAIAEGLMKSGQMDIDWLIENQGLIGPVTKKRISTKLSAQMSATSSSEARAITLQNKNDLIRVARMTTPAVNHHDAYFDAKKIDVEIALREGSLKSVTTKAQINEAGTFALNEAEIAKGASLTLAEKQLAWDTGTADLVAQMKEERDILDGKIAERADDLKAQQESQADEQEKITGQKAILKQDVRDMVLKRNPHIEKYLSGEFGGAIEAESDEEIQKVYTSVEDGSLKGFTQQEKVNIINNTVVTEIRSGKHDVGSAIQLVRKRIGGLDVSNQGHRDIIANVVAEGLDEGRTQDLLTATVFNESSRSTPLRRDPSTISGKTYNLINRLASTPFEALGLRDTFQDELKASISSGAFFSEKGRKGLMRKYNDPEFWGNIDNALKGVNTK